MCDARKVSVVGHVVRMIQERDRHGLDLYLELVRDNDEVIAEINQGLAIDPEARQLVEKEAPGFIELE